MEEIEQCIISTKAESYEWGCHNYCYHSPEMPGHVLIQRVIRNSDGKFSMESGRRVEVIPETGSTSK
jgi:hypothetical protein